MSTERPGASLPVIDPHAGKRWLERTDCDVCDTITLWSAWSHATPVSLPDGWSRPGGEARYHPGAQVVLCEVGGLLKTVYDLTGEDADAEVRRAVEEQLEIEIPTTEQ